MVKATFVHPETEEDATAFCRLANNADYVYIVRTKPGKYRVIGNDMYQTERKSKEFRIPLTGMWMWNRQRFCC